ncbi:MAG: hypothetical protein KZQ99_22185 [Candidatus Thiodiazotropha sp. (ex Dulcina madagascariensis)]|nr:hypothetical protein [Candidatus Thiodiazotropha sp. (ex Dulcina madagascariensis)]
MQALLDFFNDHPVILGAAILALAILFVAILAIIIYAFYQGREIDLWVLRIGKRQINEKLKSEQNTKILENPSYQFSCDCELTDLLYVSQDKTYGPVPGENLWSYKISNCKLSLDHPTEKALLEFDAEIKDNDQYVSQFKYFASGTFDGSIAYLEYRLTEQDRKKRSWKGITILRVPKSGPIYGSWMTTGILAHARIGMGSIQLRRK